MNNKYLNIVSDTDLLQCLYNWSARQNIKRRDELRKLHAEIERLQVENIQLREMLNNLLKADKSE